LPLSLHLATTLFAVIRRTPHEFKIACLNEIRALFPPNTTPFYAGFGNRDTDEISYLAVGIARGKIFTINPKVRDMNSIFCSGFVWTTRKDCQRRRGHCAAQTRHRQFEGLLIDSGFEYTSVFCFCCVSLARNY
jgi:hypothetical protein